tara:strand:+ start:739 stop:1266 length:528 start_codon:yes stop_codon:yes gene_type:complete
MSKKICIVGLGYVGLTLSLALAKKNYKVYGYDSNIKVLNSLKKGISHIYEKNIDNHLRRYLNKKFFLIDNLNNNFKTFIVTVGTPIIGNKKKYVSDLGQVKEISNRLSQIIKKNTLIIFRSTLPVGTTRNKIIPIFEKKKIKNCKRLFCSLCTREDCRRKCVERIRNDSSNYSWI